MSAIVSAQSVSTAPASRSVATPPPAIFPPRSTLSEATDGGEMAIGDMARQYAVSLRTLRFYEDRGLLAPRRDGTARYYGAADRVRLQMILKGKRLGFTLAEISDLIGTKAASADSDFEKKLQPQQIASQITHLERQRAEIDDAIGRLRQTYERFDAAPTTA